MNLNAFLCINDYFQTKTRNEKLVYIGIPLILSVTIVLIQYVFTKNLPSDKFTYVGMINDLISSSLTVVALFVSFSLACLTILVSSNSQNINEAKTYYLEKIVEGKRIIQREIRVDGKIITLFQYLLIDLTYTVIIQSFYILFLFSQKFFVSYIGNYSIIIFLSLNLMLLIHVIILEIKNTNNIYLIFWKSK